MSCALASTLDKPLKNERIPSFSGFRIGGVSVRISGAHDRLGWLANSSLEKFLTEVPVPDIDIQVDWADQLQRAAERPLFDSGCTWELYEEASGFRFDFYVAAHGRLPYKRLQINKEFSQAALRMNGQVLTRTALPLSPLDYPLDELLIMHRLTQENAIELHGCGIVGLDGVSNLFVGHSGAGKSTTARLWTAHQDVEILSDDRIIVRRDGPSQGGSVTEIPFQGAGSVDGYRAVRLHSSSSRSHFAQDDRVNEDGRIRMYGTPWHGEGQFASPASAPLSRICILEHGHGNVLTRLSPSQAVAELFARSFVPFHRHEYVESALGFLEEVAGQIPVYRYSFEPDQHAVEAILNFHD